MRSRDPMLLVLLVATLYVVGVGAMLASALRDSTDDVFTSADDADLAVALLPVAATVCFDVESGAGGEAIALRLVEDRIVASERQFALLLEYGGGGSELRAGRYELERGLPAAEVIRRLRAGETNESVIRIPEGLRLEELGDWLISEGVADEQSWREAITGARPESIVADRPEGASLLGYLLPATYPTGCGHPPSAESLVSDMIGALDDRLTADLRATIEEAGFTLHEVLTLASIVEKEAIQPDEQPLIASALLNRIELGIALQADPTVQFAAATANEGERGWWPEIFQEDLDFDSLYNTYQYPGIPPGPIANAGIGAIVAVLNPADTDFFYFVARCDGSNRHEFAATLEEHNINVARCHG
ncbi:MAG TPA: endolytic transglycosylase MltG [Dehalococcoidia bacterium]|nr:endolytic transglycosylase MltG [Dehalococcoidia bacterium]